MLSANAASLLGNTPTRLGNLRWNGPDKECTKRVTCEARTRTGKKIKAGDKKLVITSTLPRQG